MSCRRSASKTSPGFGRSARSPRRASGPRGRRRPPSGRGSARASSSSGSGRPSIVLGPGEDLADAPRSSRALKISTRARESSAALSSKDGFSVVAPTRVMVPSSMTGRKASSWARLKRWISSTKSSVPCPGGAPAARRLEDLLEVGDAGEDRRDLLEMELGLVREEPRDGGLAGAGRAPEDERAEGAARRSAGSGCRPARRGGPGRRPRTSLSAAAGRRAGAARLRSRPAAAKRSDIGVAAGFSRAARS